MKKYDSFRGKSGIYKISNTINDKIYIGSSVNIAKRIGDHKKTLKANNHRNKYLQNHYNKYGECLYFDIIEECEIKDLIKKEQSYIDLYKSHIRKNGFNLCPTAGSQLGFKHSEEIKKMWSVKRKGFKHSKEGKNNMSIAKQGSKHSLAKLTEEDIINIRLIHDGSRQATNIIAKQYKVSWSTIHYIIIRRTWRHI